MMNDKLAVEATEEPKPLHSERSPHEKGKLEVKQPAFPESLDKIDEQDDYNLSPEGKRKADDNDKSDEESDLDAKLSKLRRKH